MLHDPRRQALAREALALLPEGDSALRARLLSMSSLGLRSPSTLAERQATTRAAVEMARRVGDDEVLMWALDARHLVLWGAAPPQEMLESALELATLSRRMQQHETLLDALLWCANDYVELGDMLGMQRMREEYTSLVERCGSPWHSYVASGAEILQAAGFGDLRRARELSSAALNMGRRLQDGLADTFHALRLMFLDQLEGCGSRADSPYAPIDAPACVAPDYRVFWALSWASRGYDAAARNALTQTLENVDELLDALRRPVLSIMAEVAVTLGDRPAMEAIYELLLPSAGRHMLLQACVYMGSVDHYLGLLASALGRNDVACEHFERAIRSTIAPALVAQTEYLYGRTLAARRDGRDQARLLLSSARDQGQRFGLPQLRERADAALSAL